MKATMLLKRDHQAIHLLFQDFEHLDADAGEERRRVADQLRAEIDTHTRIEEELFYPELERVPEAADLVREARAEHQLVKDLCAEIGRTPPDAHDFEARIQVLRENFDRHVDMEEAEMFPLAKKHISGERLEKIADQIDVRRAELVRLREAAEV